MQDRSEWLERRSIGAGGSDIGSVLGLNPWSGPHDVWLTKKPVRDALGLGPLVDQMNEVQMRGIRAEGPIAEYWGLREGRVVNESFEEIYAHPENPILQASIDREVFDGSGRLIGMLEVKSLNDRSHSWGGELPPRVWCQVQHYLYVRPDFPVAYVVAIRASEGAWRAILAGVLTIADAVEFGIAKYESYLLERDPFYAEGIVPQITKWWNDYVVTGIAPPADSTDGCAEALMARFTNRAGDTDLTDTLINLAKEREAHRRAASGHEKDRKQIDNEIKVLMGLAKSARGAQGAITISTISQNRLNQSALKAAHPDLVEEFSTQGGHDRITISGALKEEP